MERSRTYRWDDPAELSDAARRVSGLDFLRSLTNGGSPKAPFAATLGIEPEEMDHGHAVFSFIPGEEHYNPIGGVHGGVISTLLDSAAGCAVHTTLPVGTAYTSLDLTVKFLRPITVDTGKVRAVGKVLSKGRTTALAQSELLDARDRRLAYAVSTCALFTVA